MALHNDAVDVDHQHAQVLQAALVERGELLGAGQLLRLQHQQLLDQGHGAVVHQIVDAGLRTCEQLQHRQQRLPTARKHALDLRSVVAVHDLKRWLCLTILHGGFLSSSVEVGKSDSVEFAGNRGLQVPTTQGTSPDLPCQADRSKLPIVFVWVATSFNCLIQFLSLSVSVAKRPIAE
jgi:hypothetical protein